MGHGQQHQLTAPSSLHRAAQRSRVQVGAGSGPSGRPAAKTASSAPPRLVHVVGARHPLPLRPRPHRDAERRRAARAHWPGRQPRVESVRRGRRGAGRRAAPRVRVVPRHAAVPAQRPVRPPLPVPQVRGRVPRPRGRPVPRVRRAVRADAAGGGEARSSATRASSAGTKAKQTTTHALSSGIPSSQRRTSLPAKVCTGWPETATR